MARRLIKGTVVALNNSRVATVQYYFNKIHNKYMKRLHLKKTLRARCDKEVVIGQAVTAQESRPLAKGIFWVIV